MYKKNPKIITTMITIIIVILMMIKILTRSGERTKLYFLLPGFVFPSVITTSTLETPLRSPPAGQKSAELASSRALSVRVPPPV